ncbi:MAG: SagB/ThcOx family dehydrogenase [Anaerolineae bacterium]
MKRRILDYSVITLMLASGLYVALTGWIADTFGLHQFVFHRYAGYLCVGFTSLHILLNRRRIIATLRAFARGRGRRDSAVEPELREGMVAVERRHILVGGLSAAAGFLAGWLIPDRRQTMPDEVTDIGALYHEWSSPGHLGDLPVPDWGGRPSTYKTYPDADRIPLPDPGGFRRMTVEDGIQTRRSVRDYSEEPLSLAALSGLLHAAQGITEERRKFRAAPSAGALYPIEPYVVVQRIEALHPGIYHYAVEAHELEVLQLGDFRDRVTRAGLYQAFLGQAAACFVLSAVFQRSRWKYRKRAYRYVLLETGHIAQNLYLAATSMGLGACAVGAFYDDQVNRLLGLDGQEEAALYIISVGHTVRTVRDDL